MNKILYKSFWYLVRPSGMYYEITIMDSSYKVIRREDVKMCFTEACNYCREVIDGLVERKEMNIQQARKLVVGQTVYWSLYSHKSFIVTHICRVCIAGIDTIEVTITDGISSTIVSCNQLSLEPR